MLPKAPGLKRFKKECSHAYLPNEKYSPFLILSLMIVKSVKNKLRLTNSQVCFFSSSGGGYASIFSSCYMKNSNSISINPQLILTNWPYYNDFSQITGVDLLKYDKFHRNNIVNLVKKSQSKHMIIVNSKSKHDIKMHLIPFLNGFGFNPSFGMNIYKNMLIWIYDADGLPHAHVSFETRGIFLALFNIALKFFSGFDMRKYSNLVLAINEFWYEYYDLKKSLQNTNSANDIYILSPDRSFSNNQNIKIEKLRFVISESNYNFLSIHEIIPNCIYNIIIIINTDNYQPDKKISYGLFDFSKNKIIDMQTKTIDHKLIYRFISGENINCKFIIYADEI